MTWVGSLFCVGVLFGLGAAAIAGGRWHGLVGLVGLYAVSLASVGFVAATHDFSIVPYLIPWVTAPAFGSLVGGGCVALTRPGVLAHLLGEPERTPREAA